MFNITNANGNKYSCVQDAVRKYFNISKQKEQVVGYAAGELVTNVKQEVRVMC